MICATFDQCYLLYVQSQMAIKIFKSMKSFGFPADAATYNIMIDCCSILKCYRSASALISMMLRDGFYPVTVTYTALIKVEGFKKGVFILVSAFPLFIYI